MLGWLVRISKLFLAWAGLRPVAATPPESASGRDEGQHKKILAKQLQTSPSALYPHVLPKLPAALLQSPQAEEDGVQVQTAAATAEAQAGETAPLGGLMDSSQQHAEELPPAEGTAESAPFLGDEVASLPSPLLSEGGELSTAASTLVSSTESSALHRMPTGSPDEHSEQIPAMATTLEDASDISVAVAEAADQAGVEATCASVEGTPQTDAFLLRGSSSQTAQLAAQPAAETPSEVAEESPFCDSEPSLVDDVSPAIRADSRPAQSPAPYRPRLRQRSSAAPPPVRTAARPARETSALDADLVVFFQPGDWGISLSVLLRRGIGGPEEVNVRVDGDSVSILAIDDTFFEPLPLSDIEGALRDGIAIETSDTPRLRWIRTQRVLHVFSERPGIPGFASVPRVVIGQENVILCTNEVGAEVLDFCRAADSEMPIEINGPGVPSGWRCFRGYRPKRPTQEQGVEEILLALNPKPDAAIELSGGISISRGIWITDRPPVIRLVGVQPTDGELTIDGQPAFLADGGWAASNWSAPGRHVIRYAGLSRSYEIVAPEDHWDTWNAHPGLQFSACGAAVSTPSGARSIVLLAAGCWLLGARPGQTAWAAPSVYGAAIAAPAFEPVWAIFPRVGRTRTAPRLLASNALPQQPVPCATLAAVRQWRQLLRNGPPHLAAPDADMLWQRYRDAARALKQKRRR